MKSVRLALIAVVILAVPVTASACLFSACDYITNGTFTNNGTGWNTGGASFVNGTGCSTSKMAELAPGEYIEQTFTPGAHSSWELLYRAFIVNDTDNYYDQLMITVTNNSTSQVEAFNLRGSSYTSSCTYLSHILSNDYDNVSVTVRFEVQSLGTSSWRIDNVAFWGAN